jgi:hypothetical protein
MRTRIRNIPIYNLYLKFRIPKKLGSDPGSPELPDFSCKWCMLEIGKRLGICVVCSLRLHLCLALLFST